MTAMLPTADHHRGSGVEQYEAHSPAHIPQYMRPTLKEGIGMRYPANTNLSTPNVHPICSA